MNCICGFGWFVKDNIDSARIFSFEVIHDKICLLLTGRVGGAASVLPVGAYPSLC